MLDLTAERSSPPAPWLRPETWWPALTDATAHLPATFRFNDEIYQFRDFVGPPFEVHVELDTNATDMNRPGIIQQPFGFPLVWSRAYGEGRVFQCALGHGSAWDDPRLRTLLHEGIAWAARAP